MPSISHWYTLLMWLVRVFGLKAPPMVGHHTSMDWSTDSAEVRTKGLSIIRVNAAPPPRRLGLICSSKRICLRLSRLTVLVQLLFILKYYTILKRHHISTSWISLWSRTVTIEYKYKVGSYLNSLEIFYPALDDSKSWVSLCVKL